MIFQKIIELGDKTDDDQLTFDEFARYCIDHEKKLWLVFKSIDTNNSGWLFFLYPILKIINLEVRIFTHQCYLVFITLRIILNIKESS